MTTIHHFCLPVMVMVIFGASIMLTPIKAMRPSLDISNEEYIARRIYWSITGIDLGKEKLYIQPRAIEADEINRRRNKKTPAYDPKGNELLKDLLPPVTLKDILHKLNSQDKYMEAGLRLCVNIDLWRKIELRSIFPETIANQLAASLGLVRETDHKTTSDVMTLVKNRASNPN
ncbi:uncharacterized protein LOC111044621 isoform X2 [Nilaparvata lugens]|uniref:uncharacterized protein LOC111044621 isoform X2 n=1 Tax=Nilaparvata lugens TaxID=108931 RepID=UPI00193E91C9|nr:uncharacterized protein LOC111044621 isoform X2 [Nilaparvata lugens]